MTTDVERRISVHRTLVAQAVATALIATAAAPLEAQELEEIVVTATKRAESVMDVPLTVMMFIADVNLDDVSIAFGYRNDNWSGSLYVENVFDELWYDGGSEAGRPTNPYAQYGFGPARPQTIGLRLSYEF